MLSKSTTYQKFGIMHIAIFWLTAITVQNAHAQGVEYDETAYANISGCTDSGITGYATLRQIKSDEEIKEVEIEIYVQGLSDGKHAVHIHETGQCEPCSAAKGHHDPGDFGVSTPDAPQYNHPFHMGDLKNIEVKNGEGTLVVMTNRISLEEEGRLSILDDDGSAFIIHTYEDTYCNHENELNPGCAGGPREACGVIYLPSDDDDD